MLSDITWLGQLGTGLTWKTPIGMLVIAPSINLYNDMWALPCLTPQLAAIYYFRTSMYSQDRPENYLDIKISSFKRISNGSFI